MPSHICVPFESTGKRNGLHVHQTLDLSLLNKAYCSSLMQDCMVPAGMTGEGADTDNFRKVEKQVRMLVKRACGGQLYTKQLKRNAKGSNRPVSRLDMTAGDIIDPLLRDDRLREVLTLDPSAGSASGSAALTLAARDNYPTGFYILPRAISQKDQFLWAREALEHYSDAEHTNLSNLVKLRGTEQHEGENGTRERHTVTGIWEQAVCDDNLQPLMDLRWFHAYHNCAGMLLTFL